MPHFLVSAVSPHGRAVAFLRTTRRCALPPWGLQLFGFTLAECSILLLPLDVVREGEGGVGGEGGRGKGGGGGQVMWPQHVSPPCSPNHVGGWGASAHRPRGRPHVENVYKNVGPRVCVHVRVWTAAFPTVMSPGKPGRRRGLRVLQ